MKELEKQDVSSTLLELVDQFNKENLPDKEYLDRIPSPKFHYYGKAVWEKAIAGILSGENILLVGSKATGKNILADNLAKVFNRPTWNVSFNVNTDSSNLIGTDTFENGKVKLRKGPIYLAAENGGFCILDEINMARNDAIAVLHATLDYRRIIDVPGYDKITLDKNTRFIATMNYGYIGTRELNEALTSRFMIIKVPPIKKNDLKILLSEEFPNLNDTALDQFAGIFYDLNKKNQNGEISSSSVDLRGLISAIHLIENGLSPMKALEMGIIDKSFDEYESKIVKDTIIARMPKEIVKKDLFNGQF